MTTIERLSGEQKEIHGHACDNSWKAPRLAATSEEACRQDQGNNIKANEYLDEPEVLKAKMKKVAELVKKSKFCVAYTGAGLSKASGIPDYATKAKNTVVQAPKLASSLDAQPTYAHRVLTAMERHGLIHHYVQQNHDGLPQKAGFPQEKMNEIHGAWFDPSNPVVKFSGKLRSDLFQWMLEAEQKADLCLCLGTSLSGMNADRMARTPAKKMLKNQALGTIIINLQQTPLDNVCAIRVWAKLDDAFKLLLEELGISEALIRSLPTNGTPLPEKLNHQYPIPYDTNGDRSDKEAIVLDLRVGSKIKICAPGAVNENALGEVADIRDGNYSVAIAEEKGKVRRLFGRWWVEAALRGAIPKLPLINTKPQKISAVTPMTFAELHQSESTYATPKPATTVAPVPVPTASSTTTTSSSPPKTSPPLPSNIRVIQSHKHHGEKKHSWGLKIAEGHTQFIQSVTYTLHPTFPNPVRTVSEAPFKLGCKGWGTFVVGISISLKNGKQLKAKHQLTFENEGKEVSVTQVSTN